MRKKSFNSIFVRQTRRNTLILFAGAIVFVFIFAFSLFSMYIKRSAPKYIKYYENGSVDYQVQYNENDYFDNSYLTSNRQYIASIIDNIKTNFNYRISFDDIDIEYKYTYRIEANVSVKDKKNNNLFYENNEILLERKEMIISDDEVSICEDVDIDYKKYNNMIKKFVDIYKLDNTLSILNINMYVSVIGKSDKYSDNLKKDRVLSLQIPLIEDTIAIDFIDDMVGDTNSVIKFNVSNEKYVELLIRAIILTIIGLLLVFLLVIYERKTRTAEIIYKKELKKILNNYGSNIQMLGSEFDFKNYQLLKIETFFDLLEISDKLRQPILMKKNEKKYAAYFVIPSNTNLLYVYRIQIRDLQKIKKIVNKDFNEIHE